jgi:predicted phage terminase large subunit-like protein
MARDRFGIFYVEHVIRGQWGPLERDRVIEQIAERDARLYRNEVLIYVEQEGGSGGKEVAGQMISNLSGFPVFRDVVSGTKFKTTGGEKLPGEAKIVRAMPLAAQVEAGNVRVVRALWTNDYIEELCAFPQWSYADQVDASSGAFNKLAQSEMLDPGEFARLERSKRSEDFGAACYPHTSQICTLGEFAMVAEQSQFLVERNGWHRRAGTLDSLRRLRSTQCELA